MFQYVISSGRSKQSRRKFIIGISFFSYVEEVPYRVFKNGDLWYYIYYL